MPPVPENISEFNKELVSNVRPGDWKNPKPKPLYNLVVIGAGTAGLVTAAGAAGLGAKVALIEKDLFGGDCLNVGCVPSKALIRSGRAYAEISKAFEFGIRLHEEITIDFKAVMERMRRLRAGISPNDSVQRFQELGVDVFLGEGKFISKSAVEVDGKVLNFKKAAITTGARAVSPPIEGLAQAGFLTNETVFNLTERPNRMLVVGGGPLGCELAQAFARLGSEVIIIEMAPTILAREDRDATAILEEAFNRDGINIILNSGVKKVTTDNGDKFVHVDTKGTQHVLRVDEILVGIGRAPNVDRLNLKKAEVEYDKKNGIHVNDYLQTSNSRVYAAGDVCSRYKFTHTADAAARILIQNALFGSVPLLKKKKFSELIIPWCTYTNPEIAHVGLYDTDAASRGIELDTYKIDLSKVDRAVLDGEDEGFVKIHCKKKTDKILGATVVASHAGDILNELTLAIVAGVGLKTIASVIHPYPTQSEAIKKAADTYSKTRLTPLVEKIIRTLLKT